MAGILRDNTFIDDQGDERYASSGALVPTPGAAKVITDHREGDAWLRRTSIEHSNETPDTKAFPISGTYQAPMGNILTNDRDESFTKSPKDERDGRLVLQAAAPTDPETLQPRARKTREALEKHTGGLAESLRAVEAEFIALRLGVPARVPMRENTVHERHNPELYLSFAKVSIEWGLFIETPGDEQNRKRVTESAPALMLLATKFLHPLYAEIVSKAEHSIGDVRDAQKKADDFVAALRNGRTK